jgi:hypothetical protein
MAPLKIVPPKKFPLKEPLHPVMQVATLVSNLIGEQLCNLPEVQQRPELLEKANVLWDAAYKFSEQVQEMADVELENNPQ